MSCHSMKIFEVWFGHDPSTGAEQGLMYLADRRGPAPKN